MSPEQGRQYLANYKAEDTIKSHRSSDTGINMAGADWFLSIDSAVRENANAGESGAK